MNSNAADTNKYDYVDENQRRTDATMKTNNMTELTPEDLQLVQEVIGDAIGRAKLTRQLLPTLCLVAGPLADASGIKPGSVLRTTFLWPEDKAARDQVAAALREAARQADAVMSVLVLDCVAREDKSDLILVAVAKPGHNWSAAMPMAHSGQWPAVSQSLSYKYRSYEIPHGRLDFLLGPVGVTAGGVVSGCRVAHVNDATASRLADAVLRAGQPVLVLGTYGACTAGWTGSITGVAADDRNRMVVISAKRNQNAIAEKMVAAKFLAGLLQEHGDASVLVAVDGQPYRMYSVMCCGGTTAIILGAPVNE